MTKRRLMLNRTSPDPLRSHALEFNGKPFIRHGFFTRAGGVSEGVYAGLNIGVGSSDDPIHSPDVIVVREPFAGDRPKADAIVTDRPGVAIGVSTADCGPVLYADPKAGVVGAAHAGWKGAFGGVLENTIEAMEHLGARRADIVAVLGPSISQPNYEVGAEFVERFVADEPDNERWFTSSTRAGHAMFDLNGYTVDRLRKAGVEAHWLSRCTYAEEELFYSFRRTTHRGEPDYGRQISAIVMGEG